MTPAETLPGTYYVPAKRTAFHFQAIKTRIRRRFSTLNISTWPPGQGLTHRWMCFWRASCSSRNMDILRTRYFFGRRYFIPVRVPGRDYLPRVKSTQYVWRPYISIYRYVRLVIRHYTSWHERINMGKTSILVLFFVRAYNAVLRNAWQNTRTI